MTIVVGYFLLFPSFNITSTPQLVNQPTNRTQLHVVPPNQIVSGGPPPDGIPSIDNPKFVSANEAKFLSDSSQVIGIYYNNEAKAYPLLILVWHEIVNDVVGGKPIAITYCPLCFSSLGFVREINGQTVTFGTSGKLYNNNLVMYDRLTKSLWSQIWGEAIAGNLTGYILERVPIDVLPWGEWKKLYPNTIVLGTDTGHRRSYGSDPYGNYYFNSDIYFPLSHKDNRLPLKNIVMGISINGTHKAYPTDRLVRGVIEDSVGGQDVVLLSVIDETARAFNPIVNGKKLTFQYSEGNFIDNETRTLWNYDGLAISGPLQGKSLARYPVEIDFWFAWAAFYPDTEIYPRFGVQ
jgi:hypothetical protein